MLDTLIVLATHDSPARVDAFLALQDKYPVAVVETALNDHWIERSDLPRHAFQLATPYKGYDTGAYLWTYHMLEARNYLFLQDSCVPIVPDVVEPFRSRMPRDQMGAVAWVRFPGRLWDSAEQRTAMQFIFDAPEPAFGVFGPIFYTSRKALNVLAEKGLLPPYPISKLMAQGMERGWAMAFEKAGMPVNYIYPKLAGTFDDYNMNMMPPFNKTFGSHSGRL